LAVISAESKFYPEGLGWKPPVEEIRITRETGFLKKLYFGIGVVLAGLALAWWVLWPRPIARPDYVPHVTALRAENVFVYPPHGVLRGTIVFFGNDVGFWQPHQQLADFLSRQGFAVVGLDLRQLFKAQADATPAEREKTVSAALAGFMNESQAEFHSEKLPLVLTGHSLGAEVAIWAGAHISSPRITGIVAMAPGGRGHLAITPSDYLSSALPKGPDSFSMADLVTSSPLELRIALVRGAKDGYGGADPGIVAAGGSRMKKFEIPFAGHALKKILIARYVVRDALTWVLSSREASGVGGN